MSLSFFNCHFTYFQIFSSSRPIVLTQYPFAQKCLPQYRFFNSIYVSNILMALFPFKNPITSEIEFFGENDNSKWIWPFCTLPSNISIFSTHIAAWLYLVPICLLLLLKSWIYILNTIPNGICIPTLYNKYRKWWYYGKEIKWDAPYRIYRRLQYLPWAVLESPWHCLRFPKNFKNS